ncbi:MAG: glycosyltransferase family 4 protein [Chloroflexi bacterium]|nr:glycosyltransferase family 4 protein [Chloroflexota bacterium]
MKKQIAILHFASPPTVGGVESTIYYHALGLADLGYQVRVVSGRGAPFDDRVATAIEPLFSSIHPDVLSVKSELDRGHVSAAFEDLVERHQRALATTLAGCDTCLVHNIPTLNKNLPLTTALHRYASENNIRLLAWCHDLAWTNPQYIPELHDGYPWDLLRRPWRDVVYVTVSDTRRHEVASLLGIPPEDVYVVVPGVDPAMFFRWTTTTAMLVEKLSLLDADGLLLLPARITRRKNIALGLHVLAALRRQSRQDFRLIVTGPPGPHNPANPGYLGELLSLRDQLVLSSSAHFLYAYGHDDAPLVPDNETMANLFMMADMLFFPSFQEGFGIPVLEAGLAGIPIFCSDIPPFRETGGAEANYFDPNGDAPDKIANDILSILKNSPVHHLRLRVRRFYRWESLIRNEIVPLV